jgi:hypothetical protein
MLEIFAVVLFLLALCAAFIVLPILLVLKAAQLLFERPLNEVVSAVNVYGTTTGETLMH